MHRIVRAAVAAALVIVPVTAATTAQADSPAVPQVPAGAVSVQVDDGSTKVGGGVRPDSSTQLSNGTLSFWAQNGITAGISSDVMLVGIQYQKTGGGQIYAEFYYEGGGNKYWDEGAFYQSAGQTRSYGWGTQPLPSNCSAVGGMWVSGQGDFLTPPEYPC
jgi:hypothetical protein